MNKTLLVVAVAGVAIYFLMKGKTVVQAAGTGSVANAPSGFAPLSNAFANLEATLIGQTLAGPGQTAGTDNALGTGYLEQQMAGAQTGTGSQQIVGPTLAEASTPPVIAVTPDTTDYLSSAGIDVQDSPYQAPVDATGVLSYP